MPHAHHPPYDPGRAAGLLNPLRALAHHPKRLFGDLIHPGDRVLDLGCGPGFFSLRLAEMVRPGGEVVAADIQPEMLAMLQAEIEKRALQDWIRPHRQPGEEDIGLSDPFDVILGFYMLHEVADKTAYLAQISDLLKPGGIFILVEPNFVLRTEEFTQEVVLVREAGLAPIKRPRIFLSRSVVFQAPEDLPGD